MRSQWFIGAAKLITEKNSDSSDGHALDDNLILCIDAYNAVPWLSFMAIECVLKGLLIYKKIDIKNLYEHNILKQYTLAKQYYPDISKIDDLDFFVTKYSDLVFSKSGGNRYPDKPYVPIFSHYWEVAENLRRFAKSQKN
ncbi:hypothetical protein KBD69_04800 [Candidatus Woesebacteria bacterium]|nr:hypothetical protein [Candidatus Woesebacteria bacterium]